MMIYFWKNINMYHVVILIRSVFNDDNKYYPQVFLKECSYQKRNNILYI